MSIQTDAEPVSLLDKANREKAENIFLRITSDSPESNQQDRLDEHGNLRGLLLETGAIDWPVEDENLPALYALHQAGWEPWRIRAELTAAVARENQGHIHRLLGELVLNLPPSRNHSEDPRQGHVDCLRYVWRRYTSVPLRRALMRASAKEQFIQEMLDSSITPEEIFYRRWLDPMPDRIVLEVARQSLVQTGEFILWDAYRESVIFVDNCQGTRRCSGFAMLNRGDFVRVYPQGHEADDDYMFPYGFISEQGHFEASHIGANPIFDLLSDQKSPEVIWHDHGEGSLELYFGRVDQIHYRPRIPADWIVAVEERLRDYSVEASTNRTRSPE